MDQQNAYNQHPFFPHTALPPPPPPPPLRSNDASFPILAISIVGMLATAILLLSYYIFVIKCCCLHSQVLRRISRSHRSRRPIHNRLRSAYSAYPELGGLDESAIRAIPTLRFRNSDADSRLQSFPDCAVCLNEFQEEEKMRMLPNCYHVFHIDCIDTWLQNHSNCPLCRADITPHNIASTVQLHPEFGSGTTVAIQVPNDQLPPYTHPNSERKIIRKRTSMGDECIDLRVKDKEFGALQPMRRSFSMDSSSDRQLYMAVQEILLQNPHFRGVVEGSSSGGSGRNQKSFFSFGRASKGASVLPIRITDT